MHDLLIFPQLCSWQSYSSIKLCHVFIFILPFEVINMMRGEVGMGVGESLNRCSLSKNMNFVVKFSAVSFTLNKLRFQKYFI